jgi:hypothetical protein
MIKKCDKLLMCLIIFGLFFIFVPIVSAGTENVDFGVTKTASIDAPGEVDTYTFTGNTGDGIDIRLTKTSGSLWPRITLYGSNGKEIKRSYDSTSTEILYVLTSPGTYKILVDNGFGGTYTGDYSLFVQNVNNPKNTRSVEFGASAVGSLDVPGSINTYSFNGSKGDEVFIRITKTGGSLWPRITLYGSNGKEIKRSYDSTSTEMTYTLVLPGTHTILVDNGFGGTYTGDYSLFAQTTSGNQGNTEPNENPVSPSVPAVASPIVTPSQGTTESAPREESQTNYLLLIIIATIIIGAIVIGYRTLGKKPKDVSSTVRGQVIHPPTSWEQISGTLNHDIIISYSSLDKPIADAVCAGLEARKIRCWIAPRDILPGMNYQVGIIDAISSSKIMVLIYSSNANESPHVLREATIAMSKKVIIIPFRIDDSPLSKTMEFIISVPHWLEAITPPLEKHIGELGDTIIILLENERKKRNTRKNGDSN